MVEYKRTAKGHLALMEINGRPWGSIGLPFACGIDYGRYLIDWCLEGKLPPEQLLIVRTFCAAGRSAN